MPARRPIAAVTMVYNEVDLLPVWLDHYVSELGCDNCFVVDHGSTDGSTDHLPVERICLPRSPHDDAWRAGLIADLCAGLLERYEACLYTDVDELLVVDPARHAGLVTWSATRPGDVITAIGLNVIQVVEDPPIVSGRRVGAQRGYAAFSAALCKPVFTTRRLSWAPGFHCADAPIVFDDLFLFHLRYHDRDQALARLARTRAMPWANDEAGLHQRVGDEDFTTMLRNFSTMDRRGSVAFDRTEPPLATWLDRIHESRLERAGQTYSLDLNLNAYELWSIPQRFRNRF